ncbi:MAG: DUF192 domain-containing protein [Steroidobacteraceae bacterium]|nr:DUF192 domain-containing protein [Steroidobacteraceae bacterium]
MKPLVLTVALGLLAANVADAAGRRPPPLLAGMPKAEVKVETSSGTHRFQAWIAADPASRERGLMFVRKLPADHGMLFLLERPQFTAFWMKDTFLSLDIVFIRGDGTVSNVVHGAPPGSLQPIPSTAPVIAVLEVIAGTAERIGLRAGDRVELPSGFAAGGDASRREGGQ